MDNREGTMRIENERIGGNLSCIIIDRKSLIYRYNM